MNGSKQSLLKALKKAIEMEVEFCARQVGLARGVEDDLLFSYLFDMYIGS